MAATIAASSSAAAAAPHSPPLFPAEAVSPRDPVVAVHFSIDGVLAAGAPVPPPLAARYSNDITGAVQQAVDEWEDGIRKNIVLPVRTALALELTRDRYFDPHAEKPPEGDRFGLAFHRLLTLTRQNEQEVVRREIRARACQLLQAYNSHPAYQIPNDDLDAHLKLLHPTIHGRFVEAQGFFDKAKARHVELQRSAESIDRLFEDFGFNKLANPREDLSPLLASENARRCAIFLKESSILFTMAGIYHSKRVDSNQENLSLTETIGLKYDQDHREPALRVGDAWILWSEFDRRFTATGEHTGEILERATGHRFVHNGERFIRGERYQPHNGEPTYTLHEIAYERLKRWYQEKQGGPGPGALPEYFMQISTTVRPQTKLLDVLITHVCVHLIAPRPDGKADVYLFSWEGGPQGAMLRQNPGRSLETIRGALSQYDFDAFRSLQGGKKRVTTLQLSPEEFASQKALFVQVSGQEILFNLENQNCAAFGDFALRKLPRFVHLNFNTNPASWLWDGLTRVNMPYFTPIIRKIDEVYNRVEKFLLTYLPPPIRALLEVIWKLIFFIPKLLLTIVTNLLIMALGGGAHEAGLHARDGDSFRGLPQRLQLVSNWTDVFRKETYSVKSTFLIMDWQKRQRTTFDFQDAQHPRFYIVPPESEVRLNGPALPAPSSSATASAAR